MINWLPLSTAGLGDQAGGGVGAGDQRKEGSAVPLAMVTAMAGGHGGGSDEGAACKLWFSRFLQLCTRSTRR